MKSIIIDNCIVSKFMDNGIRIRPIKQAEQTNLRIRLLQKITYGNREKDNNILSLLASGAMNFEDLITNSII